MAPAKKECKVSNCDKPSKKAGFCGWCHRKYVKGILNHDGSLAYKEAKKQQAKARRDAKREAKKELDVWKSRKEDIKSRLTLPLLKVIQDEHPETRESFGCPVFSIQMSEVECYGRIYLRNRYKECAKCHIHDGRMGFLEEYLDKQEAKDGEK